MSSRIIFRSHGVTGAVDDDHVDFFCLFICSNWRVKIFAIDRLCKQVFRIPRHPRTDRSQEEATSLKLTAANIPCAWTMFQVTLFRSTWGVGRGAEGWGDSGADVADGKDSWPAHSSHQPVFDLVPEFEPGKPWKVRLFIHLTSLLGWLGHARRPEMGLGLGYKMRLARFITIDTFDCLVWIAQPRACVL